ncbi:MAG: hypothetical protein ILP16_02805 [Spirochaetales bacterium]|nr:hypothetical protein [Spirochaetales bacterium]
MKKGEGKKLDRVKVMEIRESEIKEIIAEKFKVPASHVVLGFDLEAEDRDLFFAMIAHERDKP